MIALRWLLLPAALWTVALPSAPAPPNPDEFEAVGVVQASPALCGHPPVPAALNIVIHRPGPNAWMLAIQGVSALGCAFGDLAACQGTGDFFAGGLTIGNCLPLPGVGTLGPFVSVVAPCAGELCPDLAVGPVHFGMDLGTFDGTLTLASHPLL